MDDFSIKYISKEHADHLIQGLCNHYQEVDIDWEGKHFCGIHLKWDYANHTCDLSMPGYVKNALHKFQHPTPKKSQDNPYPTTAKQYGMKVQLTDPIDTSAPSPFMKSNIYNRSLAPSFFMAVPLTPPFSLPSANSHPTKSPPQKLPNTPATSFLTIVPPTLMAPFTTMPVT